MHLFRLNRPVFLLLFFLLPLCARATIDTKPADLFSLKTYLQVQGTRLGFDSDLSGNSAYYDVLRDAADERLITLVGYQLTFMNRFSLSYFNVDGEASSLSSGAKEIRSTLNFGRLWIDVFVQNFSSLGLSTEKSDFWVSGDHTIAPGTELDHYGANFFFIHDEKNFSIAAVMDQTARQLDSGGSLLYGVSVFRTEFSNTGTFFSGPNAVEPVSGEERISQGEFTTLTASVGYGHTFVGFKRFYLSGIFLGGVGPQSQKYTVGSEEKSRVSYATKLNAALGVGMNGETVFSGVTLRFDVLSYKTSDVTITNRQTDLQLFVGFRI